MNFMENIRIAFRGLKTNKLRAVLTMLGIIIGVGAVIIMVAIGQGAKASVTGQIEGLGSNLLIVMPGSSNVGGVRGGAGSLSDLTMDDVKAIQTDADAVDTVAPTANTQAQVIMGSQNTNTQIVGTTPSFAQVRNQPVSLGRFITQRDIDTNAKVAVLGVTVVQDLGASYGNILGKTIKINREPFQVVGILESKGSSGISNNDDQIIIPISTAQTRLIGSKSVRTLYVEAKSSDLMNTAYVEIEQILRHRHKLTNTQQDDFNIMSQSDILSTVSSVTQSLTLLLSGIAGISLLVGGIGIMNIMLVSVTERTREIGIRKAIGAKRSTIMFQFLIEAVVLSVCGGLLGILFGSGGASALHSMVGMTIQVSTSSILLAFAFSAAIGIIFGVFPAQKAAKLDPIDALRYE